MASSRLRLAILALLLGVSGLVACEELPDAPNPPRIRRTPPPDFFEPAPDPSASPGAPSPTPRPSPSALPPAPREGQIVKTGSNYLEFLDGTQGGKLLFFAFPYDSRVQGLRAAVSDGSGTFTVDGTAFKATPYLDEERNLFFYLFPKVGPGSHQVDVSVKVKDVTYSGSFTYRQ